MLLTVLHAAAAWTTLSANSLARSSTSLPRAQIHLRATDVFRTNEFDLWWEQRRQANTLNGRKRRGMTTPVAVTVPNGVSAGQQFLMTFDTHQTMVTCPDGCGPGSQITVNVDVPVKEPNPLQLSRNSVAQVMSEFVGSNFCKTTCNVHNLPPSEFGNIDLMFEEVKVSGEDLLRPARRGSRHAGHTHAPSVPRVEVRLKRVFDERNEALLDRLSKYLRARIPQPHLEFYALHRDGRDVF